MNTIIQRFTSPTPSFFKILRNIGLALATAGGAILTAPVSLPGIIATIGGYLVTAGGVLTAVSQVTTERDDLMPSANGIISKVDLRSKRKK